MLSYQVSVKDLISFYYCEGSISSTFLGKSRANLGTSAHKLIQASRPANYLKEVFLQEVITTPTFTLTLSGRADGLYTPVNNEPVIIEEIKSTYLALDYLTANPNKQHLAQVKIYAYIYAHQNELKEVETHLTYYNLNSKTQEKIKETYSSVALEEFYNNILDSYLAWLQSKTEYVNLRNDSLTSLEFPFAIQREGQRKMMVGVYKTIEKSAVIRIQAPTGIGKTMAVIYPALKTLATGLNDRLFYLTTKGTNADVVENSCRILHNKEANFKAIFLTAKAKICFNPEKSCDGNDCIYAKNYYDKFAKIRDEVYNHNLFTQAVLEDIALKYEICPFELSLDFSEYCDLIIADCNYFFDSKARLQRYFLEIKENYSLLCDEAHNLPERVRNNYSAEINRDLIVETRRETANAPSNLKQHLKELNKLLIEQEKSYEHGDWIIETIDPEVLESINKYLALMDAWLAQNPQSEAKAKLLELYFYFNDFIRIYNQIDKSFVLYIQKHKRINFKIFCLDPSPIIDKLTSEVKSIIYFSATLEPEDYFSYLLKTSLKENYSLFLPSAYPPENMCVIYDRVIETTYKNREQFYVQIADKIVTTLNAYQGNYIIFFPSYNYLNLISNLVEPQISNLEIVKQSKDLTAQERVDVLNSFSTKNIALFAVAGGFFGEGIDLEGDLIKGCIIVGISLPMVNFERKLINDYYSQEGKNGFDYAYKFPALTRVIQSAGRLIRRETDTGLLLLLDKRFLYPSYNQYLPEGWSSEYIATDSEDITGFVKEWRKKN